MTPRVRAGLAGGVLLAAALLLGASLAQRGMGGGAYGGYGMGPGMMGGYGPGQGYGYGGGYGPGMMGQGYGGYGGQELDWNAADAVIRESGQGATVDTATNTVSYQGTHVTIDVIAVQPGKPDTTFEVAGLADPTVKVPLGATVTLDLVNMDYGSDMPHGLVLTRLPPPYPYTPMPLMMSGGLFSGIPPLAARTDEDLQSARYASASMQFRADAPGTYYYVCQVPGHAQHGMYGKLVIG